MSDCWILSMANCAVVAQLEGWMCSSQLREERCSVPRRDQHGVWKQSQHLVAGFDQQGLS
jgi:hypothetical protein